MVFQPLTTCAANCLRLLPRLALAAGLAGAAPGGWALDRASSLQQANHTAWGEQHGAPAMASALAQTADGFLWIGSAAGLVRFDGVSFVHQPSPSGAPGSPGIRSLYVDRQERLWVGYIFGGASVIDVQGKVSNFLPGQGLPEGSVISFGQTPDGTIWAITNRALARFDGRTWQTVPAEAGPFTSLSVDKHGVLWLGNDLGLYYLRPGEQAVRRLAAFEKGNSYANVLAADLLWVQQEKYLSGYRIDAGHCGQRAVHIPQGYSFHQYIARDGNFYSDGKDGLYRRVLLGGPGSYGLEGVGAQEQLTESQGMSGRAVTTMLEDRERNLWATTNGGLDRFRNSRFRMLAGEGTTNGEFSIDATDAGAVWLGAAEVGLQRFGAQPQAFPQLGTHIAAISRAADGTGDVASNFSIWHFDGVNWSKLPDPPEPVAIHRRVQSLVRDRRGRLWMSQIAQGVFLLEEGKWRKAALPGLFAGPAIFMHLDRKGTIWLGYPGNRLAAVDETDTVRRFDRADGLAVGNVTAISSAGGTLWVGGDQGVAHFDGARFQMLAGERADAFAGTSAILRSADGALWLNGSRGISRIPSASVEGFLKQSETRVAYERFNYLDGVDGVAAQIAPLPTGSLSSDGKLWFVTSKKVISIDPLHIARNPLPPQVHLLAVHSDGKTYAAGGGAVRLPPHTTGFDIAYTAPSLRMPERLRFRYLLESVDREWQDADNRRVAYYTNLKPGDYRFRVAAANEDGVWSTSDAAMTVTIEPAFYQTRLFQLLCAVLAATGLWALYSARERLRAARIEARLAERVQIARELHDTVLQSTQGMILHFQAVADKIPRNDPARTTIERELDRAELTLGEVRDRVQELRAPAAFGEPGFGPLVDWRRGLADLMQNALVPVVLEVAGSPRPLVPAVCEEAMGVLREALANAVRHSKASAIGILVDYGGKAFSIHVQDDGVGIPAELLAAGGRQGHWGMVGMRERAAKIDAVLDIRSSAGAGTDVRLRLPAARAYPRRRPLLMRWLGRWR
jgi:signal transduction histidine kinase/ligand-binding sensor domain-containing protein